MKGTLLHAAGSAALTYAQQLVFAGEHGATVTVEELDRKVARLATEYGITVKQVEAEAQRISKGGK